MGDFSGLTPRIIPAATNYTGGRNTAIAKFPNVATVIDAFYMMEKVTAASTINYVRCTLLNGKTTGNQTTNLAVAGARAGGSNVAWAAYTAKNVTTNYTFSANHWLVWRYSENGTITDGNQSATWHAVEGNV